VLEAALTFLANLHGRILTSLKCDQHMVAFFDGSACLVNEHTNMATALSYPLYDRTTLKEIEV
jgi:hypothetical protein